MAADRITVVVVALLCSYVNAKAVNRPDPCANCTEQEYCMLDERGQNHACSPFCADKYECMFGYKCDERGHCYIPSAEECALTCPHKLLFAWECHYCPYRANENENAEPRMQSDSAVFSENDVDALDYDSDASEEEEDAIGDKIEASAGDVKALYNAFYASVDETFAFYYDSDGLEEEEDADYGNSGEEEGTTVGYSSRNETLVPPGHTSRSDKSAELAAEASKEDREPLYGDDELEANTSAPLDFLRAADR